MFETLQPTAYTVSFIFYALASITTILRVYSRKCIIKSFGGDDWWMVMGFVRSVAPNLLASAVLTRRQTFNTAQQEHFYPNDQAVLLKLLFAEEILYIWMQFIIKMSFLLFYLRLASKTSYTYSVYATMILNLVIAVGLWLLYCLQCRPLQAFWNSAAYPDATCLDTSVAYYVPVSLNIMTDFIILFLPIRPLCNIQASLSRRLGVIAVVTVGGVAVGVSCLRIIVLHEFAVNPDFTYILGKMVIISAVELNVAIMAANAPSLKAVWLKHINGSISNYISSVQLSSLSKKQHTNAPERSVIRHRVNPKHNHNLAYSSSMNNLVEPCGSRDT
ncbi:hypothetical protein BJY01DRAFT_232806 [Aspergillus pseudoustus]|uniref:Rhodopsin domain-containing protein n=1 Tax=Aspergillus pseudoustus TaxID=1810923 RepID=A0ABR4KI14_9EURO